jgi:ABC-type uncharacterized transport system permease subunit
MKFRFKALRLRLAIIAGAIGGITWAILDFNIKWPTLSNSPDFLWSHQNRIEGELQARLVTIVTVAIVLFILAPLASKMIEKQPS